jgi:putative hydrolase of the HAD superfamily
MKPGAIIYDIDNTLYSYDDAHAKAWNALTEYASRTFSISPERFFEWHRRASRALEAHTGGPCAAIHDRLIRYQVMMELEGLPLAHAPEMCRIYWNALLNALKPYPGLVETFERLKSMGYSLGIGTNMTADYQFEKLSRLGVLRLLDFFVSSEEASAEKPDPRLFELCAGKAGLSPEACVFVGDSLTGDVLGAKNAGMRAVWFTPRPEPAETPPGAFRIHAHAELPNLLSTL